MGFDASTLFASFVVSGAGFVAFMYGKKQSRVPQMVVGLALMIFPYFLSSPLLILAIGGLLLALLWGVLRLGW